MNTLSIGSITSGTMRPADLVPALIHELETVRGPSVYADFLVPEEAWHDDEDPFWDTEEAGDLVSELFNALEEYLPPYCYVGSNPGDGADLGVWIDWDTIEMDQHDGELVKIEAGDERPPAEPDGPGAILEVNDHGNCTLYVRTPNADYEPPADEWREAWAVV